MPTTAWRFAGTEGADNAVTRLKQLAAQDMINLVDVTVLRWPEHAVEPMTTEHANSEGGKVASMLRKLQRASVDSSMIDTVRGDLRPGNSAVVVLSSDANFDAVVQAFEGEQMELVRTDLSVPDQDRLRLEVEAARRRRGPL